MVLKIECQSRTTLGTAWRAEVTQQRGGQSGGQRMRVELKAASQTGSLALDYRSCHWCFPVCVSLKNSTKDSFLRNSTKETWSLKLYMYLKRIRTTDDNYSSHID